MGRPFAQCSHGWTALETFMETTFTLELRPAAKEIARVLLASRKPVAEAFAESLKLMPRWKLQMEEELPRWDRFVQTEFFAFADYLARYFNEGDVTYKQLFIGEKIKSLYDADLDDVARQAQVDAVNASERCGLAAVLQPALSAAAWQLFSSELAIIHKLLGAVSKTLQRVLLIGDCIFLDIVPFIVGDLLEADIKLLPDYATSKNPLELRDQLRKLSAKKFDLVFFSPFSYDFIAEYSQLAEWRQSFASGQAVSAVVENSWRGVRTTLEVIADLFDCPVHIHNSAAIVREENGVKRLLKLKATAKVRHAAKQQVNELLAAYVAAKNQDTFKHLFILDENSVAMAFGESRAGAYYYRTAVQHPAVHGRILAPLYTDTIYVNAHLVKKKLVVSDLDNTLWEGVIGEGAVRHYHDRQDALKRLKAKGVVLAVNSKNDPANVHWLGGTLSERDFVCAAISWEPKVQGMKRIQTDLNLEMKDFVFIDDREDELDLMRTAYPDVLCLDATDARTWHRLGLWKDYLDDNIEMDRTLMYQQREERKAFVKDDIASDEEKTALFRSLGLKLTITRARPADLKRVAELINRTNQFNLEGSRTSLKEVTEWHKSPKHIVLTGQTSDRFGDMGTTCVAVARCEGTEMELLPFVLSCRVFGYGIERSLLNHLKDEARRAGVRTIVGRHVPTPQNAPCKGFLADNGFEEEEGRLTYRVAGGQFSAVEWLEVVVA